MTRYELIVSDHAERQLARFHGDLAQRLRDAIVQLIENPRPHGCLKLTGKPDWRIRVGDYRIRYLIDDKSRTVEIVEVLRRSSAY